MRSARQDDLALLRQFGKPGFAYSGATPHLLPFIARARVVNQYDTPAYFRDDNRVAPHNLYADGRVLRAEAPGASTARDIGFRFGPPARWPAPARPWCSATDARGGCTGPGPTRTAAPPTPCRPAPG